jgi:hypothetical protein
MPSPNAVISALISTTQLQTSLTERTNRGAYDFNFSQAPRVMQFLFRLIADLRMVHTRLNLTPAFSIEIERDPLRVLYNNKCDINDGCFELRNPLLTARERQYMIPVSSRCFPGCTLPYPSRPGLSSTVSKRLCNADSFDKGDL